MKSDYAYISARIRSKEKLIADITDIERMVDAVNANDAFKVLNDTDLADNLLDVVPKDYSKAIAGDMLDVKNFLVNNTPDQNLTQLLLASDDFNNIKILFKKKHTEIDTDVELSNAGYVEIEKLQNAIMENKKVRLGDELETILQKLQNSISKDTEPHIIDNVIEKEYFSYINTLAQKINNPLIKAFVKNEIDNANAGMKDRAKQLGKDQDFFSEQKISGGSSEKAGKSTLEFLSQVRFAPIGPEVVLEYYYKKMNAMRNIRLVMIGKLNGLANEQIKEKIIL